MSICDKCVYKTFCNLGIETIITGCSKFKLKRPLTNADKIRAMSDEELCDEYFRILNHELWKYTDSRAGLFDWLRQEVE